jgi:hypothetical protein
MATNTQVVISVPDWARAYVQQYADRAYALWQTPAFVLYSGDIVADQEQNEADGIAGLAARGASGDLVISKATAFALDAIGGGYLPGTKSGFTTALGYVTSNSTSDFASVNSRIGKKSMYVGDSDSTYLAQTLATGYPSLFNARVSAAIYQDNYVKERNLLDHSLSYGVELGKHPVIDAETLRKAGLADREYLQNAYTINHKWWLEGQDMAVANLEIMGNMLRSLTNSSSTTTQSDPSGSSKLMTAVGLGVVGYFAGGAVGGLIAGAEAGSIAGPIGAVVGAAIGVIAGLIWG